MAIDFSGKVSQDDIQRVSDKRNHPQYADGFGGDDDMGDDDFDFTIDDSGSDFGFDDSEDDGLGALFGGSGDSFGGGSSGFGGDSGFGNNSGLGGFGSNAFGNNGFSNNGFGGNTGFGNTGFGNNGFNQNNVNNQQANADTMDKMIDASVEAAKSLGTVLVELFKSLKERSADDFGYLSTNMITVGGILSVVGLVLGIAGNLADISFISLHGMGMQLILGGLMSLTTGITGIGVSAFVLSKVDSSEEGNMSLENVNDIPSGDDNFTDEYESNIGDELDDLFGDDFDAMFDDLDNELEEAAAAEPEEIEEEDFEDDMIYTDDQDNSLLATLDSELEKLQENKYISRQTLFETFKPMFPTCTPQFTSRKEIDENSSEFKNLETICIKALARIANCEIEEIDSSLESAVESFFSYELRLKRVNKVKKLDELAKEIEAYVKEDADDDSVNATITLDGDFYKIIITKGETAIVTFGDVFKEQYCCDFYLNTKNKLPVITGIDELGKVIVEDAKNFDTMLIAGKPRSGKSWYVLSMLMSLMLFNSPEQVQFIIVDPKESNLFKTLSFMPHVCGLHNDEHILEILDDIIEVEAPRRKKILKDNRCDDIWALWSKGIQVPILYLVIDEYITVINNLDSDEQKDFNIKIQTLISQLPSLGIRLIFVPHRSTGIVNKTNRTMIQFAASVRCNIPDVEDTLDIKGWKRALTNPGDIAVKSSTMKNAAYVRGAALTPEDGTNTIFIEKAATAFYKMGVDIPDMSNMRIACNRDEDYIRHELSTPGANMVQYDIRKELDDIENTDFSDI